MMDAHLMPCLYSARGGPAPHSTLLLEVSPAPTAHLRLPQYGFEVGPSCSNTNVWMLEVAMSGPWGLKGAIRSTTAWAAPIAHKGVIALGGSQVADTANTYAQGCCPTLDMVDVGHDTHSLMTPHMGLITL